MYKRKYRLAAAAFLLLLVMVLSACGASNDAQKAEGSENAAAVTEKESASANEGADKAKTEAEPAAKEEASDGEMRTYASVKGDIKIPAHPQRIVTDYYAGELLTVGANVVGAEPSVKDNPFFEGLLNDTEDVGYPTNLEKAITLKPDLIVVMYDDQYDALSKIAPTVYIPYGTASTVEDNVKLFGDLTGRAAEADAFLADFEKIAEEGRAKLAGVVDENATFGLYEITDKGELWTFGENSGRAGQAIYNALQLKMPEKIKTDVADKDGFLQLSMEVLPDYAADYMFVTSYDPEKKGDKLKELQNSAVWKNLPAVKANRVFVNDFDKFYRYDPISIKGQVTEIVDMLTKNAEESK
ncbi:iron-hydroxamate ABC transporter substrate-binding protein [Saccharibacillus alkalitolerans]|uniref:Iron-hydroxamate ABC transporter substrate-binding protein n=1 Tax=Saccharibacillus alkalitolerans TaxID=2705290 RepID=A0ABX0F7J7_9BACL|nr:iron-hydroxamate ABC transporter substrate-binding protein [Saccharibacillus alkalitolerans]NGZ75176.1 iron-hydroxamate ABC transporter substrate-binding protein [Saccharibacillus alkalitolerans]